MASPQFFRAPDGQLMMRVLHCGPDPPPMAFYCPPEPMLAHVPERREQEPLHYGGHTWEDTHPRWEEQHDLGGHIGRHIVRDDYDSPAGQRGQRGGRRDSPGGQRAQPSRRRREGSNKIRVAGGYKVFDSKQNASDDLFYGTSHVGRGHRYHEVAPRATPRIEAPASNPRPHVHKRRDIDGRSFGELSSEHWPGTEFTRRDATIAPTETAAHTSQRGYTAAHTASHTPSHGEKPPSRDGRRYEGVDEAEFYDPIYTIQRWDGGFGGPFTDVEHPRHPWEGGYTREVAPYARVG